MRFGFLRATIVLFAAGYLSPLSVAGTDSSCSSCGEAAQVGGCVANACSSCGCGVGLPAVCGVGNCCSCWDCSNEEGIDVDSLTPESQSKQLKDAMMARIVFIGPDDAGVSLMGQKMMTLGKKRSFVVPVDSIDRTYKYEVKVDVVRGGKKYFKVHKIDNLQAGTILELAVTADAPADGEPMTIGIEPNQVAPKEKEAEAATAETAAEAESESGEKKE